MLILYRQNKIAVIMYKFTPTTEQQNLFNLYFNKNEFLGKKAEVEKALAESKSLEDAMVKLNGYDDDEDEDGASFYAEKEYYCDNQEEDEYFSFEFLIAYSDSDAHIESVGLYCGESGMLCRFDLDTYEIPEWC